MELVYVKTEFLKAVALGKCFYNGIAHVETIRFDSLLY